MQVRTSYLDAVIQAQIEEMERDPNVIVMGEDIAVYGGGKLMQRFDSRRIWSMPISEGGFTGVGIGAAATGLRPIVDVGIASFMYLASDQIINQASKLRYMTGGQVRLPIVFRCTMYYGSSIAAQHSDRPYPMFMNVPGLKLICPTTPSDAKGMLKAAVRDDDPVIMFEDTRLWSQKGEVSSNPDYLVPLGKAAVTRSGTDVTIIAIGGAMRPTLEAAEKLTSHGIRAEVIDLRTLRPLDRTTILLSLKKTGRLIVVENAHRVCNVGAEIAAIVAEEAFDSLERPIIRLSAPDVHVPFSPALEEALYPGSAQIIDTVKRLV